MNASAEEAIAEINRILEDLVLEGKARKNGEGTRLTRRYRKSLKQK